LRIEVPYLPLSQPVRKTLNKIRDIRRRVEKIQSRYGVEEPCYINPYFSALIEIWADGAEWEAIVDQIDMGEGDIVRAFKRTVDVLRQFTVIDNVPEELVFTAREAIDQVMREPVNIE
jgi:superfamily II RNA helicase